MLPAIKSPKMPRKKSKRFLGCNNSAMSELPSIAISSSISSLWLSKTSNSASIKTSTINNLSLSGIDLSRALIDIIVLITNEFSKFNISIDEVSERVHNFGMEEAPKQILLNALIGIFLPAILAVTPEKNTRKTVIPTTLADIIPVVAEVEASIEKRQLKLQRKAMANLMDLLQLTQKDRQMTVVGRINKLYQAEMTKKDGDTAKLEYSRFIAQPHIIDRKMSNTHANRCIFCAIHFASIEMLQAHLITMKHSLLLLPEDWANTVDMVRTAIRHNAEMDLRKTKYQESLGDDADENKYDNRKMSRMDSQNEYPHDNLNSNALVYEENYMLKRIVTSPVSRCLFCDKTTNLSSGEDMHRCTREVGFQVLRERSY